MERLFFLNLNAFLKNDLLAVSPPFKYLFMKTILPKISNGIFLD